MKHSSSAGALMSVLFFCLIRLSLGQGSLTPPGLPAPLFKTLQQIEPRTEINATNTPGDGISIFRITAPGSYYLTANVTGVSGKSGIAIASNDVTVDLNGFELIGVAGSSTGIRTDTTVTRGVMVRNGNVRGWGSNGIDLSVTRGPVVDHVTVADNSGIGLLFAGGVVTHCTAVRNGSHGFTTSAISGGNGDSTRAAVFDGCSASANAGSGFTVNGIARNCSATHNGASGFSVFSGSVVGCYSSSNAVGILAGSSTVVRDNSVTFNTTAGIQIVASTSAAEVRGNTVGGTATSLIGLDVQGAGNFIIGNYVSGCTDNYAIAAGNQVELLLSEIPETIEVPAKVTLVGDLTGVAGSNGITVASDGVTIDLAGHALIGVVSSVDGIVVSGTHSHLTVRNGIIRNWGDDGIDCDTATAGFFSDLDLASNTASGLEGGDQIVVQRVISRTNGAIGISVQTNSQVVDCVVATNGSTGISAGDGSTVQRCTVQGNTGSGISVSDNSRVLDNTCDLHDEAGSSGISVSADRNRIEGNHLTRNTTGLTLTSTANNNIVIRNTASGNATGYNIVGASNDVGPIGTAALMSSPWANLQN
jgi:parallel beta-helix repeat protein